MKDTIREECDPRPDCLQNCCITTLLASLFFVVFVLVAQFVLVNVVVAVLMKHLEESHKQVSQTETLDKLCNNEIIQVKFEDLFLVQCFRLCFIEIKEKLLNLFGRNLKRKERNQKSDLTHKIETYFD